MMRPLIRLLELQKRGIRIRHHGQWPHWCVRQAEGVKEIYKLGLKVT